MNLNYKNIEVFCEYFNKKIIEIQKIESSLLKKILLVAIIDSLSKNSEPNSSEKHGRKFKNFITFYSDWEDSQKVSLPLLFQSDKNNYSFLEDKYKKLNTKSSRIYYPKEVDINIEEIILQPNFENLTKEEIQKFEKDKFQIEQFRHVSLFYKYRNYLVHEFREPSFSGLENTPFNERPYYILTNVSENKKIWQLTYSDNFFLDIASSCLSNIKKYLIENDKNPYDNYEI